MNPRLRTFLFKGGSPVQFRFPSNPVVRHTGGDTLCSLFLFDDDVDTLRQILGSCGIALQEMGSGQEKDEADKHDPLPTCLTCFWLDPNGQCGLLSWDKPTIREASRHPEASPAIIACTTPEIWKENSSG